MFDVQRVQQSWQKEVAALGAVLADLSEKAAQQPIRDDGWTIQDLLGHIATSARAFLMWSREAEHGKPVLGSDRERDALNDAQRTRNAARPWAETHSFWERTSAEVAEFLPTLTAQHAERPLLIPWLPQVQTVGDALRVLILHTRSHREEITNGIQALTARADE